jgi:hypothetical protein
VSVTLPVICELVVTVRVAVPAAAVIVTELAFDAVQVNVTLWPEAIEAVLVVRETVGVATTWLEPPPHAQRMPVASRAIPEPI